MCESFDQIMSKTSKRGCGVEKKSTLMKQESPIWDSFLEFQQVKDLKFSTADVHLICANRIVPAHAFILQAVSPFFDKMFTAQVRTFKWIFENSNQCSLITVSYFNHARSFLIF